jgi:PhnB protein
MSKTQIIPYVFFGGRCQEALDFYTSALGAQVDSVMLYSQSPDPAPEGMLPEGYENKVMHAAFRIGESTIYGGDGIMGGQDAPFASFSLVLNVSTEAEAQSAFRALADGGQVTMPIGTTFWSPLFGMVTDRFGMEWMVSLPQNDA